MYRLVFATNVEEEWPVTVRLVHPISKNGFANIVFLNCAASRNAQTL